MSKKIKIALAILFCSFFVWGLVTKFIGVKSFILEILLLTPNIFIVLPFIAIVFEKNKYRRIFLFLFGLIFAYVLVAIVEIPRTTIVRFYYQAKNHTELSNLSVNDISYISIGDVTFDRPEQIEPIVKVINNSTWYSPNHEWRGKEVPMTIVLRTGQTMYFRVSRFDDENSADVLFIRPNPSGFWADGNAYVPKLPSTLEGLGFSLAPSH